MKVIYKVQLALRKKGKMISQQKWGILLFIYRIFPGTKENVFIKGLLAYKYKHINVRHWEHLAKLFASNLSCLLVLSPGDPSGIPWRVCSPMGRDLIWLLALPSSVDTQYGKDYSQRRAQPHTCTALLSLFSPADIAHVLGFPVLSLQIFAQFFGVWGKSPVAQGAMDLVYSPDLLFSKEVVCVTQVSVGVCGDLTGSDR